MAVLRDFALFLASYPTQHTTYQDISDTIGVSFLFFSNNYGRCQLTVGALQAVGSPQQHIQYVDDIFNYCEIPQNIGVTETGVHCTIPLGLAAHQAIRLVPLTYTKHEISKGREGKEK